MRGVLWSVTLVLYGVLAAAQPALGEAVPVARPDGIITTCLALIVCGVAASAEELVSRGYLIARLERLLGGTGLAVVVSTALFASLHIYQGTLGVVNATVTGLAYATWFCLFRRLWPLCLVHAANNFVIVSAYG